MKEHVHIAVHVRSGCVRFVRWLLTIKYYYFLYITNLPFYYGQIKAPKEMRIIRKKNHIFEEKDSND